MELNLNYYFCEICGKLIVLLNNTGTPTICCGQIMKKIIPNTVDAATEKHVPVITTRKNLVTVYVGEENHPMTPEHYIQWILLQTEKGIQKKKLSPTDKPVASFALSPEERVLAAYAYCNLHKLWMVKI